MDIFDLSGTVALITGGNGGIGLAYGKGLVKAGAKVAIWGRNEEKNAQALKTLREMGGRAEAFVCDVTDPSQVDTAFQDTMGTFGQVDVCFANAGGAGPQGMLHQIEDEAWQGVLDLNLNSVVYTYRKVITQLLERKAPGKLIVTSSVAGLLGTGYAAGYSTTKAAVLGLTRALAIELGRKGIQVNAILPGYIETEMSVKTSDMFKEAVLRRSASGTFGTLEQMEGIAVFLASSASDFMTGQSIILDGGHVINPI
ncbi:MAG: SDR family NAD(P)-dependent oxidoreductase [Bacteroidota bacterium]